MQDSSPPGTPPELSAIVVHWRDELHLDELIAGWPEDPRFELVVVDNSATLGPLAPPARKLDPRQNLGFAGGVNYGAAATRGDRLLILNPDVLPLGAALDALLQAFDENPEAAGIVPHLEGSNGEDQFSWQLQPLPRPLTLLAQTLFFSRPRGPLREPARGSAIEQPAAAALALRREVFDALGGFDEGYYPAWFEDVDFARRLESAGKTMLYEPRARFRHALGSTVRRLGYGPFLWVYDRNLVRYVRSHHGALWTALVRFALPIGLLLRLCALPLWRPSRAASRLEAAAGLLGAAAGALSGWRRPRSWARRFAPPPAAGGGR